MKVLITKSDGTPTKSKVYAKQFLQEKGISEDCLIQENGQFFYEGVNDADLPIATPIRKDELPPVEEIFESTKSLMGQTNYSPVTWDTPVFDKNNERTKLYIPGTDVVATINGKHPGGQIRPVSSFEINIGNENFIMSVDLIGRIFKIRG